MSAFHYSKFLRFYCTAFIIFVAALLLFSSCGEPKYKFIDDGVLQAPDGTIYHRCDRLVYFCSDISLGEFLGSVKMYRGEVSDDYNLDGTYKKGVYSLSSDGSNDFIAFVEADYISYFSEYERHQQPRIYVKDGCELSYNDWDKVIDVSLVLIDSEISEEMPDRGNYSLKQGYNASDFMKALIADNYIVDHGADYIHFYGYVHYRLKGIDMIDIYYPLNQYARQGWIMSAAEADNYHINTEAFAMFEIPERISDYLEIPASELLDELLSEDKSLGKSLGLW